MAMIGTILVFVLLADFIFLIAMLRRNNAVYHYKMRLLEGIDTHLGDEEFNRQLRIFKSVTYNEMVLRFWRPLDSFYAGKGLKLPTRESASGTT